MFEKAYLNNSEIGRVILSPGLASIEKLGIRGFTSIPSASL
jgi:hypothetical protein